LARRKRIDEHVAAVARRESFHRGLGKQVRASVVHDDEGSGEAVWAGRFTASRRLGIRSSFVVRAVRLRLDAAAYDFSLLVVPSRFLTSNCFLGIFDVCAYTGRTRPGSFGRFQISVPIRGAERVAVARAAIAFQMHDVATLFWTDVDVVSSNLAGGADKRIVVHVATGKSFRSVHPTKNILTGVDISKRMAVPIVVTTT
jgi:hypothetical protein